MQATVGSSEYILEIFQIEQIVIGLDVVCVFEIFRNVEMFLEERIYSVRDEKKEV